MNSIRLWNVTDWPETSHKTTDLVVMGKLVKPGQFLDVVPETYEGSSKTKVLVSSKMLHKGKTPPAGYGRAKKIRVPKRHHGGHGKGGALFQPSSTSSSKEIPEEGKAPKKRSRAFFDAPPEDKPLKVGHGEDGD